MPEDHREPNGHESNRPPTLAPVAWVGVLAALVYVPTLFYGFVNYDDPWLIENNMLLKNPSWHVLSTLLFDLSSDLRFRLGAEYLPVRDLSVMLDFALFDDWVPGHRLTQITLYGAACALLARATQDWFSSRGLAWATAILFALHPVHVEAVAWMSERKGLLAAVFVALSLIALKRFCLHGKWRWLFSCCLLLCLAVWSKAYAVATLGVMLGLVLFAPRSEHSVSIRRLMLSIAALAVVAALAFWPTLVVGDHMNMVQPYHGGSMGASAWLFGRLHWEYVKLMFMAQPYAIAYAVDASAPGSWQPWVGYGFAVLFVLPVAFCFWELAQRRRPGAVVGTLALASTAWFAYLAPVSQVVFPIQNLMADRYLFLPSWGACLAVGVLVSRLRRYGRVLLAVVCTLALSITVLQTRTWSSTVDLYSHTVAIVPGHARAWNQLALLAVADKDLDLAWTITEEGLKHSPGDWRLIHRRALIERDRGNVDEAIRLFRQAAQHPRADSAMTNLAMMLVGFKQSEEAIVWARKAAKTDPRTPRNQRTLGTVLMFFSKFEEAREPIERALAAEPENPQNQFNHGWYLLGAGEVRRGEQILRRVVSEHPAFRRDANDLLRRYTGSGPGGSPDAQN